MTEWVNSYQTYEFVSIKMTTSGTTEIEEMVDSDQEFEQESIDDDGSDNSKCHCSSFSKCVSF